MSSVKLDAVTKRFGDKTAIDNIHLSVKDGEFFVLLGPSGAGKTTTLRLIAGLERPDAGRVMLGDQDASDIAPAYRNCAFVFQQYSLYPHLTVFDNMAFPLRSPLLKTDPAEIKKRVEQVAQLLHIEAKLQRKATALSGGEMQRVAIGRALVRRPNVYLMDEPLSSLDAKLREELRIELRRIQRETGATVVYVTHDQVEATTMADRIGILEDGRLEQVDTPESIYNQPSNLNVAQRLGSPAINVFPPAWLQQIQPDDIGHVPAKTHSIAIRPEDVELRSAGVAHAFDVVESSLAKHLIVTEKAGVEIRAHSVLDHAIAPGSHLGLSLPIHKCLFFDAQGRTLPQSLHRS
jgi:multiple sugar transport system ATP-binding protein